MSVPPGCFPVFVASDSEGKFGHHCPRCRAYWRSGPHPNRCPYCALTTASHQFLSVAQRKYVAHYCETLDNALGEIENGECTIDMDLVADSVEKADDEKPSFYVSEKSQQRKFICPACNEFNDILGRYGYCSACGTRSDLQDFEDQITAIRAQLTTGGQPPENLLRSAISAFDSLVGQYAKELARLVPMTKSRRSRLEDRRFHDLNRIRTELKEWFDIDIASGIKVTEINFAATCFHRRHIYEHHGGEVTTKYLEDSGDKTVTLKQALHEKPEDMHILLGTLIKLAKNLHNGFHELFPPSEQPIKAHKEKVERIAQWKKSQGHDEQE
ncbi:MAG: hypothetical protein V4463_04695 [Pseudomonadota bacterium]